MREKKGRNEGEESQRWGRRKPEMKEKNVRDEGEERQRWGKRKPDMREKKGRNEGEEREENGLVEEGEPINNITKHNFIVEAKMINQDLGSISNHITLLLCSWYFLVLPDILLYSFVYAYYLVWPGMPWHSLVFSSIPNYSSIFLGIGWYPGISEFSLLVLGI